MINLRSAIIASIRNTITAAAPTGLGIRTFDDRSVWDKYLSTLKNPGEEAAYPPQWTPPFAVLDTTPEETASVYSIGAGALNVTVGETTYRRKYRRTHNLRWQPTLLLAAKDKDAADELLGLFIERQPQVVTLAESGDDDTELIFGAKIQVVSSAVVTMPKLANNTAFYNIALRCDYGRYTYTDRAYRRVTPTIHESEE